MEKREVELGPTVRRVRRRSCSTRRVGGAILGLAALGRRRRNGSGAATAQGEKERIGL
ncbi:hypothetical protein Droror1_Dr00023944, partial [Drosera rotundifolia]